MEWFNFILSSLKILNPWHPDLASQGIKTMNSILDISYGKSTCCNLLSNAVTNNNTFMFQIHGNGRLNTRTKYSKKSRTKKSKLFVSISILSHQENPKWKTTDSLVSSHVKSRNHRVSELARNYFKSAVFVFNNFFNHYQVLSFWRNCF